MYLLFIWIESTNISLSQLKGTYCINNFIEVASHLDLSNRTFIFFHLLAYDLTHLSWQTVIESTQIDLNQLKSNSWSIRFSYQDFSWLNSK